MKATTLRLAIAALAVCALGWQVSAKEIANPVVTNAQLRGFTHGQYPSLGNKTHVGVDLAAPCGSPVFSFADGEVIDVVASKTDDPRRFDALGYMVLIEHPDSLIGKKFYTLYLHFQLPPSVAKGDSVWVNHLLGVVGDTGEKTSGCHTHFEVRFFADLYFQPWAGIYGNGDQRESLYFKLAWADPLSMFVAYPNGVSAAQGESGSAASTRDQKNKEAQADKGAEEERQSKGTFTVPEVRRQIRENAARFELAYSEKALSIVGVLYQANFVKEAQENISKDADRALVVSIVEPMYSMFNPSKLRPAETSALMNGVGALCAITKDTEIDYALALDSDDFVVIKGVVLTIAREVPVLSPCVIKKTAISR